jgi:alkaline phosphatase D
MKYSLQVLGSDGTVRDARELRTLDAKKSRVRFAVASCMDDVYANEQAGMWTDLLSRSPDLIFLIGDNVYADRPTIPGVGTLPEVLWKRYAETRDLLAIFRAPLLVPILAVWDDNDYGANNGDRTYRFRNKSREVFESFFAQAAIPGVLERGPGVSSRLAAFGQQFFLMDDRSFRAPPLAKNHQTHWGKEQERWLYQHLGRGAAPAWVLNGDQFFGAYHRFESYERLHPSSFRAFLAQLRKLPTPVVLVSGDRHLTELMAIGEQETGYRTFELTTSAIHAKTYPDPWTATPNPRQIAGAANVFNYAIVDSEAVPGGLEFTVTAYGPGGKILYERELRVNRQSPGKRNLTP